MAESRGRILKTKCQRIIVSVACTKGKNELVAHSVAVHLVCLARARAARPLPPARPRRLHANSAGDKIRFSYWHRGFRAPPVARTRRLGPGDAPGTGRSNALEVEEKLVKSEAYFATLILLSVFLRPTFFVSSFFVFVSQCLFSSVWSSLLYLCLCLSVGLLLTLTPPPPLSLFIALKLRMLFVCFLPVFSSNYVLTHAKPYVKMNLNKQNKLTINILVLR